MKFTPNNIRWYDYEKRYIERFLLEGLLFEEIADKINSFRKSRAEGKSCVVRSERAVTIQAFKMGLIQPEDFEKLEDKWKKDSEETLRKRANNSKQRENVLHRDGTKCVYCGSRDNVQFAHIIPFKQTKTNDEEEAVTLCQEHHKLFDEKNNSVTLKVFEWMKSCYSDYTQNYQLKETVCREHGLHYSIIKRVGQNPPQNNKEESNASKS